ncbi:MAG: RHS repeat-associated core domain-containing protein, partial [Kiritimatiellae bacterium]|nr:RHS repeat-associated core domain-containing protein [Kiritimatiellia bacterium]
SKERDASGLVYYGFRHASPELCRWITPDPARESGGLNLYAFCGGNPIQQIDITGEWAFWDDLVFIGGGAILGIAGRIAGDILSLELSGWEDYVGAAIGGAVSAEILLYTENPMLAGSAGATAGNLMSQTMRKLSGKQCEFDSNSLLFDTGVGTAIGAFFKGRPKIGVNAGRGSDLQVYRMMQTRLRKQQVQSVGTETARKMFRGISHETNMLKGNASGSTASTVYGLITSGDDCCD